MIAIMLSTNAAYVDVLRPLLLTLLGLSTHDQLLDQVTQQLITDYLPFSFTADFGRPIDMENFLKWCCAVHVTNNHPRPDRLHAVCANLAAAVSLRDLDAIVGALVDGFIENRLTHLTARRHNRTLAVDAQQCIADHDPAWLVAFPECLNHPPMLAQVEARYPGFLVIADLLQDTEVDTNARRLAMHVWLAKAPLLTTAVQLPCFE